MTGQGIILIHDGIFMRRATMAAMSLRTGNAKILAPESLDWDVAGVADAILSPVREAVDSDNPKPIHDDLDMLLGSR